MSSRNGKQVSTKRGCGAVGQYGVCNYARHKEEIDRKEKMKYENPKYRYSELGSQRNIGKCKLKPEVGWL